MSACGVLLMVKRLPLSRLLSAFTNDRSRIEASVRGRLRGNAAIADIMQDTWLKLANQPEDAAINNPSAFVSLVARNTATDHVRKERRRSVINEEVRELLWDSEDELTPERILIGRQAAARLMEAIDELPAQTKRIFMMNRFEGMTHREIAENVGMTERAVFYHLRRALEHLATIRQHLPD